MFNTQTDNVQAGINRYILLSDRKILQFNKVLDLWQNDEEFRSFFIELLFDAPFAGYRFETPSVTKQTQTEAFEFVLVDSPWLECQPDQTAFAEHFNNAMDEDVVVFNNLGADATLIVPVPGPCKSSYGHIAAFIRHAPEVQKHAIWQVVAQSMIHKLSDQPI